MFSINGCWMNSFMIQIWKIVFLFSCESDSDSNNEFSLRIIIVSGFHVWLGIILLAVSLDAFASFDIMLAVGDIFAQQF